MDSDRESLKPVQGANRSWRQRLGIKGEFTLALLPTLTVLAVLWVVEAWSHQRLLFASLASSAFLIYLDPQHGTNSTRTLLISQLGAAIFGFVTLLAFGPGYASAGAAMLATIALMIFFDAVHPPAVSTALSFAFRPGQQSDVLLFGLAVGMITLLVGLQRACVLLLSRYHNGENRVR